MSKTKQLLSFLLLGLWLFVSVTFALDLNSSNISTYCNFWANLCILNQSITSIAPNTFINNTNLTTLYIVDDNLPTILSGTFNGLGPKLKEIHFYHNNISTIEDWAFRNLPNLTLLDISRNSFTGIARNTFTGLSKLVNLDLSQGILSFIETGTFDTLTKLQTLSLGRNNFSTRQDWLFSGLFNWVTWTTYLWLNSNNITAITSGMFKWLSNVKTLDLMYDKIASIESWSFIGLTWLTQISLQENSIIPSTLDPFTLSLFNRINPSRASQQYIYWCKNPLSSNYNSNATIDDWTCDTTTHLNGTNILNRCSTWATSCDLSNLSITSIAPNTFVNNTNLTSLYLNSNSISTLFSWVFDWLTNLQTLDIWGSLITGLQNWVFSGLNSVTSLNLGYNQITTIEDGAFNGLSNVQYIYLNWNPLNQISSGMFLWLTSSLSVLDLNADQISTIKAGTFEILTGLQTLNLQGNLLTSIEADSFIGLSNLLQLSLDANQITGLQNNVFNGLSNVTYMGVGNNSLLTTIDSWVFQGMTSLQQLDINSTHIQKISAWTFSGLSSLKYLHLQDDQIESIDAGAFTNAAIISLSISNNQITSLPVGVFSGLSQLTELYLDSNKLTQLSTNVFGDLSSLQTLSMQSNQISNIEAWALNGLSSLYTLYLQNNKVGVLKSWVFSGLSNVSNLSLDGNPIKEIETDAFNHGPQLNYLSLNGFGIETLHDWAFNGLSSLNSLDLSYNQLTSFSPTVFTNLPNLSSLNLSYNKKLSTLRSWAFAWMPNLRWLYLYSNQITSIESWAFNWLSNLNYVSLWSNCLDLSDTNLMSYLNLFPVSLWNQYVCIDLRYSPSTDTSWPVVGTVIFTWWQAANRATLESNNANISHTWTGNGLYAFDLYSLLNDPSYLSFAKATWHYSLLGTVDRISADTTAPIWTINYSPASTTTGNVVATLSLNESGSITNNGWSGTYIFTWNGSFTFMFQDTIGNTWTATATVTWIQTPTASSHGGGGWGSIIAQDICPSWDYSLNYYDGKCKPPFMSVTTWTTAPIIAPISDEIINAYKRSFTKGITTLPTLASARVQDMLTRAEMAKMIVNYAINSLGKTLDTSKQASFADLNGQTDEMKWYITKAYQLWLMWVHVTNFNPLWLVTRGEFSTVLARLLYGQEAQGSGLYYDKPIATLSQKWIIKNTDPLMKEVRGYVMLMLMRAAK